MDYLFRHDMIEVDGLEKSFGNAQALRGVSFLAKNGEITGLLGANGAGKSTTLRIISGLQRPDYGVVRIDGSQAWCVPQQRIQLGALLDHTGLYDRLTARENIAYYGELQRLPSMHIQAAADELIASLGLEFEANRRISGFSVGQRAKVAFARAVIHSPSNLLLDEPTNGLDIPSIRVIRTLLRKMRDAGCCVIFSSHVLDEAEQICDRIVVLSNGVVVGSGSPGEICHQTSCSRLEDAFMQLTGK